MKHILTFLIVIAVFAISFTLAPTISNPTGFVTSDGEEETVEEIPSFRIYTKAECSNVSDFIICHDELFAQCGGLEYKLPNGENLGSGIFPADWEDPRDG